MATTADDVWRLLAELTTAQKETERLIKAQSQESEKRFQETERRFQEGERRFQETERLLKEQSQATDRQLQQTDLQLQKTDLQLQELAQQVDKVTRQVDRVSQQIGDLGSKWGRFLENMVAPACERLFFKREILVHQVSQRVRRYFNGDTLEIDVLVNNQDHVLVVEVKITLRVDDVRDLIEDLQQFRQFFPEYEQKQLYGAVAAMEIEESVYKYAYRQGLFVLALSGETMVIVNSADFQPKVW